MLKFANWAPKVLLSAVLLMTSASAYAAEIINGAGATFPQPIYTKWFYEYNQKTGYSINYQGIGSGGGIKQVSEGTVDFGASDAPLTGDDQAKKKLVMIPTVAGAVTLTYNIPGVETGLKLTPDIIAGIYLGNITKWNDSRIQAVNAGIQMPDLGIVVARRSDGSGTTDIFTHYLSSVSAEWSSKVGAGTAVKWPVGVGGKGNPGVAGIVKNTKGAIGYVELAYVIQNKMAYATVQNKAGNFIVPSIASTRAAAATAQIPDNFYVYIVNAPGADAYPISGFTFLLIKKHYPDKAIGKAVVEFVKWAYQTGDKAAESLYYVPLPEDLKTRAIASLGSVK